MAERKSPKPDGEDQGGPKDEANPEAEGKAAEKTTAEISPGEESPAPSLEERMEGMQGWMAEIEKRQERSSRFGGIAVLLAILASAAALVLGVMNRQDAATQDDIDELTDKVNDLGSSVERQTETQLSSIDQRLSALEQQIKSLTTRQREAEAQTNKLQTRVADAETAAQAAKAAAAAAEATANSNRGANNP